MSDNLILKDVSVAELKEIRAAADREAKAAKEYLSCVDAEVTRRFAQIGMEGLLREGKNHGTYTFEVDGVKLKIDLKQSVKWDTAALRSIASSLDVDTIDHLFDIEFSIPEAKFKALMPGELLARVKTARTTRLGDPKITFTD